MSLLSEFYKRATAFGLGVLTTALIVTHADTIKAALPSPVAEMLQEEVIITNDPGGEIYSRMELYNSYRMNDTKVRFEGLCASACTFFLGMLEPENVCAGPNAYFGFHGVYKRKMMSLDPPEFDPGMTRWTYEYVYPLEIRQLLEDKGWSMDHDVDKVLNPTGLIWLRPGQIGVQPCG